MRVGLGVSTGTEVVCAALIVAEDDGSYSVEYRTVSADTQANTDIGDLVSSAVELMSSLAPVEPGHGAHSSERREPDTVAVSYRTPEQASSIRSACAHSNRAIALIPESAAAHAFLAESGLIARYRTVAVVDIGASGTTISILDSHSGTVLATERTETFGGNVVDALVKDLVHGNPVRSRDVRDDLRDERGIGSARYRAVKEHLSTHDSADLDRNDGASAVDRADLDAAILPLVATVGHSTARLAANHELEAVVLIGGGANTPSVRTAFEATLRLPVLAVSEPDAVLAQGAAQVSLSGNAHLYPTVGARSDGQTKSVGRFSGALVGALVVGGIVLAYGVQTLTPSDDSGYSPAGSAVPSEPQTTVDEQVLNTTTRDASSGNSGQQLPATSTRSDASYSQRPTSTTAAVDPSSPGTTSTRTPTLHPAPDLPVIPYPAQPTEPSPPPVTQTPEPSTSPPAESTTEPVTPTPSPEESSESPSDTPSDSPSETPSRSTAVVPAPSIPTTDVDRAPLSPGLEPPPTVWSPPAPSPTTAPSVAPESSTTVQPNPTTTTE
ncbi:Hsp70 family protein [Rhodococcoides kyotonense]|uniref:Hsp70 protein n=1 Tax=Rhodococcoides kyotonense TaxID=398843 RepID=A0A239MQ91_9NOCA|nr:Hsp70 family protein [Rhodococcus kyotonensis]SNT44284.1 Hsp70 protein [Rhodococcus kyotonensis]